MDQFSRHIYDGVYLNCPSKYNFYKSNLLELAQRLLLIQRQVRPAWSFWSSLLTKEVLLKDIKEDNQLTSIQVTNSVLLLLFHLDRLKSHCVLVNLLSVTKSPPPIPKIPTNKSFLAEFDCGTIRYHLIHPFVTLICDLRLRGHNLAPNFTNSSVAVVNIVL